MADPSSSSTTYDLTCPRARDYLRDVHGVTVSVEYLRRRCVDHTLPHLRLTRRGTILLAKADLDAWVKRSRVPARAS